MSDDNNHGRRFGHVAILGAPNAGKSTLTNALVGEKVSIVTHKVQTTRTRILGIAMHGQTQMLLVDTPGVFAPKKSLDRALVQEAWAALDMADIILVMVDAARKNISDETRAILERVDGLDCQKSLVLNKVDATKKEHLLQLSAQLHALLDFDRVFMVSALKGSGVDDVSAWLANAMPEGEWAYDAELATTLPMRLAAAEITREKLFLNCHQEIPYSTAVLTDQWAHEDGRLLIRQTIILERDSQKGVVIGKAGSMLKRIGSTARAEIEELVGEKVHLDIHVKVDRDWTQKAKADQLIKGIH